MKLLSHGPEPCASANSAISAYLFLSPQFLHGRGKPRRSISLNPHNIKTEKSDLTNLITDMTRPEPCASANSAMAAYFLIPRCVVSTRLVYSILRHLSSPFYKKISFIKKTEDWSFAAAKRGGERPLI